MPDTKTSALLRVPRILWGAMLASIGVYAFVYFNVRAGELPEPEPIMLPALAAVAVVVAVLSFVVPARLHAMALSRAKLEIEEVPDPNASVMFRDQTPTIRVFAAPDEARRRAFAIYQTPLILSIALSEAVALFGLVLGMLGFEPVFVLPFMALGALLIALRFPTAARAVGPLEAAKDARLLD